MPLDAWKVVAGIPATRDRSLFPGTFLDALGQSYVGNGPHGASQERSNFLDPVRRRSFLKWLVGIHYFGEVGTLLVLDPVFGIGTDINIHGLSQDRRARDRYKNKKNRNIPNKASGK